MPKGFAGAAVLAGFLAAAPAVQAGEPTRWGVQAMLGAPLNAPTPLAIRQSGEPDLRLDASWSTKPFELPFYWIVGAFARQGRCEAWAELVHHKLYLSNPPPEVQSFSVSHGFNLFFLGLGREMTPWLWARAGAGLVLAHPESSVRGRSLSGGGGLLGYGLAGPALTAGAQARWRPIDRLGLIGGASLIGAYAVVPVEGGSARVLNLSVHFTAGVDVEVIR